MEATKSWSHHWVPQYGNSFLGGGFSDPELQNRPSSLGPNVESPHQVNMSSYAAVRLQKKKKSVKQNRCTTSSRWSMRKKLADKREQKREKVDVTDTLESSLTSLMTRCGTHFAKRPYWLYPVSHI
jgi:hypothetical protein